MGRRSGECAGNSGNFRNGRKSSVYPFKSFVDNSHAVWSILRVVFDAVMQEFQKTVRRVLLNWYGNFKISSITLPLKKCLALHSRYIMIPCEDSTILFYGLKRTPVKQNFM